MSNQKTEHPKESALIEMREGTAGPRAAIAGTRIDVWMIASAYRDCNWDFDELAQVFDMLSREQLRAAIDYYESNLAEVTAWIESNDALTEEKVRELYPELFD